MKMQECLTHKAKGGKEEMLCILRNQEEYGGASGLPRYKQQSDWKKEIGIRLFP